MELTMKKTMESTEQSWNNAVKFQEVLEKTERSRVLHTAEAKKVAERWFECEEARHNREECGHGLRKDQQINGGI